MNCSEAQEMLSAYYDGELSSALEASVRQHLNECPQCAQELTVFKKLSALSKELDSPHPPSESWKSLEKQLECKHGTRTFLSRFFGKRVSPGRLVAAAAVILLVAFGGYALWIWMNHNPHHHLSVTFSEYLEKFETSPEEAQKILVQNYHGREVTLREAEEKLRYRPVVAKGLPGSYVLKSVFLLDMPCCTCPQAVFKRKDGTVLSVFEYDEDQPAWFGNRPCICARCHGTPTTIIQANEKLAATWKKGNRYITIIGAKDMEEVIQLVGHLGSQGKI